MSRFLVTGIVSIAFGLLMTAMAANASVLMYYTGPEGNQSGNVYTYPYNFTINSSSQQYELMCDDFNHEISPNTSWTANTLEVPDLNGTNVSHLNYPSAGVEGYLEAAYLFVEEATAYNNSNSDPEGLYNWAVWDLLTGVDESGSRLSSGDETTVQNYLSAAEAAGSSLTPSQFPGVVIYTPTDMSSGGPQEFFGYNTPPLSPIPEPASLSLLLSGALLMLRRHKRGRA